MGNEMEPNPASTILARWSSRRLLYSLCQVRLLRFNEQRVSLKIPWIFVSVQYSSFFFLLSRVGKKSVRLATFFCGCLLGWLLSKAAVSKKMNCVCGEKLAKQQCLAAVKQRLTKPVCMDVNCMYRRFYYNKKTPGGSIYQSSYWSVPRERCFTGSRSNNQSDQERRGRDWKGRVWRDYSKFKPNLRNNGISSTTYVALLN